MASRREWREVKTAGYGRTLRYNPGPSRCGDIEDGVSFQNNSDGPWVVPLSELYEMVYEAEAKRADPARSRESLKRNAESAIKHTAAVAELADVDPQQAYEFFERIGSDSVERAAALLAKMQERPEPVDEVARLRALVAALMPVWEIACDYVGDPPRPGHHPPWHLALRDYVDTNRPRVAAALAGVVVRDEAIAVIRDEDISVRSIGRPNPGGQHVGTYAGVCAVHMPTGVAVVVDDERSQVKNREKAVQRLRETMRYRSSAPPRDKARQRCAWCQSGGRSSNQRGCTCHNIPDGLTAKESDALDELREWLGNSMHDWDPEQNHSAVLSAIDKLRGQR